MERLVAFDEGCIDIKHAGKYGRYEYGVNTDERMKTVLHVPLCGEAVGGITVYFYVIVNPVVGCVGIYFTTGTTDLKRRYVDWTEEPAGGFKVTRRCQWIWVQSICCASDAPPPHGRATPWPPRPPNSSHQKPACPLCHSFC